MNNFLFVQLFQATSDKIEGFSYLKNKYFDSKLNIPIENVQPAKKIDKCKCCSFFTTTCATSPRPSKWCEPRSNSSSHSVIIRLRVILKRTAVDD